ncbi:MAG: CRISPR-associated endonuclease Cas1 [Saccharolobus sp.]|uniref:CRISPR-associated endonuclease Cas1 n=1 Tax=Saccharolobus TaxID=2100760 RepID=UPI001F0D159B|nr:CRISPR-associated endonuclease Cas1 [Saccharolobus shibatae]MCH4816224.1 CRISPR-associated endonuclease Cas1 [Saccharolobus shibatae]
MILIVKKARVTRKGSDLIVESSKGVREFSTLDLDMLVIVGSEVVIDSGTLLFLSSINAPVLIHGKRYDVVLVPPFLTSISEIRKAQYNISDSQGLFIARSFIEGKIKGMYNVAKYFSYIHKVDISNVGVSKINEVKDIDSLRLVEAELSKDMWEELRKFLPKEFPGRKPRNEDPINRSIDYVYSLIYGLCTHALLSAGLDPYYGFMHRNYPGRVSLTYDFSEMFKPFAVHVVISSVNKFSIDIDRKGYLESKSLVTITRNFYEMMSKRKLRGVIYGKANELKKSIVEFKAFSPYIYKPK